MPASILPPSSPKRNKRPRNSAPVSPLILLFGDNNPGTPHHDFFNTIDDAQPTTIDGSSVPRRALCEEITKASWYTDAVLTQTDFGDCVKARPDIEALVHNLLVQEDMIFNSTKQVFLDMRTILGLQPVTSAPTLVSKESVPLTGKAWARLYQLNLYYRLLDRIWLYNSPQTFNIVNHAKTLENSSFKPWQIIENLQQFLKEKLPLEAKSTRTYGPRLLGSGLLQQLKDLALLGQSGNVAKIHHNILMAALSINVLSEVKKLDDPMQDATELEHEQESIVEIISHAHLTRGEGDILRNMFECEADGKASRVAIHRTLHIAMGISPLFLMAPYKLDRQRWSIADIYKESQQLGNWRSPLLVRMEKTVLENVFGVANGSLDASQAFTAIIQSLPWTEINDMLADDPTNTRFRRIHSSDAIPPNVSLTTSVDKGKGRDVSTYQTDTVEQRMESGNNDDEPMDTTFTKKFFTVSAFHSSTLMEGQDCTKKFFRVTPDYHSVNIENTKARIYVVIRSNETKKH
ncbi:hypothetical protein BJ912DRAFT_1063436 [Pholiota molesta]|nr:hypothetical protein BJ912DRAFT_1063436 [Pholiota molesta]